MICPDYEIRLWNENNYDINIIPYVSEAYRVGKLGFVPDYIRTDIIYRYGGFYFDTDVELIKNLDDLLDKKCIMGFEHAKSINHGHGFAAEPGNPILKELMEMYESLHFVNEDGSLNLTASPIYITQLLVSHGLRLNNSMQNIDGISVFPTEYFCPKNYITGDIDITDNTYSIHHFNMSWMSEESINRLNARRKYIAKYGSFLGANIYDFLEAKKNQGARGMFELLVKKIKNKIERSNV